jgi:DNA-binding response OmpR family regulator
MRIIVVEDEPELAALIRQGLVRAGMAVDLAGGVRAAEDSLAVAQYDAAVFDLALPDGDGLTLLHDLRRARSVLPVLILTARDAPDDRVTGLDAGADDYLTKPFYMPELVSRLRALLRRPGLAPLVAIEIGNVRFDTASRQVSIDGRDAALTQRETALLELLMRGRKRVLTRDVIEQGLYDFSTPLGSNAVDVLVHRLRHKLRRNGATISVHALRGVGYMLAEPS